MCDVIQMGEAKGHVESQLHHTSCVKWLTTGYIWAGENKLCQDIFPAKQLQESFSTI